MAGWTSALDRHPGGGMTTAPSSQRRVLVTGHRGYLGSVMLPRLQSAGWSVAGLDCELYAGSEFAAGGPLPSVPWRRLDIRDVEAADLAGFHAVIHLAGLSNDPLGSLDPALTDEINHRASLHLAEAAREAGVERFVFASSCSNYGAGGEAMKDDRMLGEDAPLLPVTPYGRSKVAAEAALHRLADKRFGVTSLRLATAYGLSPRLRFDLVVNNLVAWALSEGRILLKSDGSPWRPLVHVEDIADAFLAALEAPPEQVCGRVLNVVPPGENHRIGDVAQMVAEAIPGAEIHFAADAGPDLRNYRVDASRILALLPTWQPRWTVARGIAQLVAALRPACPPSSAFEGPPFQRLGHLKQSQAAGLFDGRLRARLAGSVAA